MENAHIRSVESFQSGGNIWLDIIILKHTDEVVGISEDCVCIYKSYEDFMGQTTEPSCIYFKGADE